MGDTAKAALDTAEDNRHIGIGLTAALTIDDSGAVRAFVCHIARRVRIIATNLAIGGIAVDHAVHITRGHAVRIDWLAKRHKGVFTLPVRLGDDTDAKAL